jgi:hypothetical protein
MKARYQSKSSYGKLSVPKEEGYRSAAAKRLQTPEFEPDEAPMPSPEEAEAPQDETSGFNVTAEDIQGIANLTGASNSTKKKKG